MPPSLYKQLTSAESTRLLHVLPGEAGTVLRLSLVEVHLNEKPVFDAISYTWGYEKHSIYLGQ